MKLRWTNKRNPEEWLEMSFSEATVKSMMEEHGMADRSMFLEEAKSMMADSGDLDDVFIVEVLEP